MDKYLNFHNLMHLLMSHARKRCFFLFWFLKDISHFQYPRQKEVPPRRHKVETLKDIKEEKN